MGGLRIWGGHSNFLYYIHTYIIIYTYRIYVYIIIYIYAHVFFTAGLKQKGATTQMNLEDDLTEPTHLPRPIGSFFFPCKGAHYKGLKHFKPRRLVAIQMHTLYKYTKGRVGVIAYIIPVVPSFKFYDLLIIFHLSAANPRKTMCRCFFWGKHPCYFGNNPDSN